MVHTKVVSSGFQGLSVNFRILNCLSASVHAPEVLFLFLVWAEDLKYLRVLQEFPGCFVLSSFAQEIVRHCQNSSTLWPYPYLCQNIHITGFY